MGTPNPAGIPAGQRRGTGDAAPRPAMPPRHFPFLHFPKRSWVPWRGQIPPPTHRFVPGDPLFGRFPGTKGPLGTRGRGWRRGHHTQHPDISGIPTQNTGRILPRPRRGAGLALGAVQGPSQGVPVPPLPVTPALGGTLADGGAQAMPGHHAVPTQGHGHPGCHAPWLGGHRPPPHLPVTGTSPPPEGWVWRWGGTTQPTLGCPSP